MIPIVATVTVGSGVAARLGPAGVRRVGDRLAQRMTALLIRMQSTVKGQKLSGQVLNRRTGKLSRSIHFDVVREADGSVLGRLYAGKETPYAKVHEYGLLVHVPPQIRVIRQVFGKAIEPRPIFIRAHDVQYRERSFLRSTLREYATRFRQTVHAAVAEAGASA